MKLREYTIEGVIYGLSHLQAGAVDRLQPGKDEKEKDFEARRTRLIVRTAMTKRDEHEPKRKEPVSATAAKQGMSSTKDTRG